MMEYETVFLKILSFQPQTLISLLSQNKAIDVLFSLLVLMMYMRVPEIVISSIGEHLKIQLPLQYYRWLFF